VTGCKHTLGEVLRDDGDGWFRSECPRCWELLSWTHHDVVFKLMEKHLAEFVTDVTGVVAWAESLVPGNIEAQKVVDELNAVLTRRKP
jgi:hypothetical protein